MTQQSLGYNSLLIVTMQSGSEKYYVRILWGGFQEAKLSLKMGLRTNLCHDPPPTPARELSRQSWGKPSPAGPAKAVCAWCGKGRIVKRMRGMHGAMDLHVLRWGKFRFRGKDLRRVSYGLGLTEPHHLLLDGEEVLQRLPCA